MRLKILARPSGTIDGIALDQFRVGAIYDIGTQVGSVFLAEGWAELVADDGTPALAHPQAAAMLKPLILIVDDDPAVRHLGETLLAAHGYHVISAANGREGIQRLREHCPDLILLDLQMPVMDGWDFRAKQCAAADATAAIPVVIVSAAEDARAHARRLGAAAVLEKPFEPDALVNVVTAVVGPPGSRSPGDRRRP